MGYKQKILILETFIKVQKEDMYVVFWKFF